MQAELQHLIVSQSCTGLGIGPFPLQEIKSLLSGRHQSIQLARAETNNDKGEDDDVDTDGGDEDNQYRIIKLLLLLLLPPLLLALYEY